MPQTQAVIPNVQPQATIPSSPSSEALFIGMWDPLATLPLIQPQFSLTNGSYNCLYLLYSFGVHRRMGKSVTERLPTSNVAHSDENMARLRANLFHLLQLP